MVSSILFVCLGNICRSPLAEGVAKAYAKELSLALKIDSAGTSSHHVGEPPCDYSIRIAEQNGIDIASQRARAIRSEDKTNFELIIALDRSNKQTLLSQGFQNVRLLGEFGGYGGRDVADPYYFATYDEGIAEVFEMIRICTHDLLDKVAKHAL